MTLTVFFRPHNLNLKTEILPNISMIEIRGDYVYLTPILGEEIKLDTKLGDIKVLRALD